MAGAAVMIMGLTPAGASAETVSVPNDASWVSSSTVFDASHTYRITASGAIGCCSPPFTFGINNEDAIYCFDPVACATPSVRRDLTFVIGSYQGAGLDQLTGQETSNPYVSQIPYNPNHVYSGQVTGVSGTMSMKINYAAFQGQLTVQIDDLGASGGSTPITFTFKAYANNVRNLKRWQLGKSRFRGGGTLETGAISGSVKDVDVPRFGRRGGITSKVTGYSLAKRGSAKILTLTVEVVTSSNRAHCPIGTVGTVTLVDDPARLSNRQSSDSFKSEYPARCRSHIHGVNNANSRNTGPRRGGYPRGGQWAVVKIVDG